jgi:hypothetical protein
VNRLRALLAFLYDFAVGDDPLMAVLVVAALAVTGVLAGAGIAAWWVLPVVVLAGLAWSVDRATRAR